MSDHDAGPADSAQFDEDVVISDPLESELVAPTSLRQGWVRGRIMWWSATLAIASIFPMIVGLFSSPGFWWSEGPFTGPPCWELGFKHGDSPRGILATLTGPLLIGAVLLGMFAARLPTRGRGLRAVAFPRHRRTTIGFAVLVMTAVGARAIFDASVHLTADGQYTACVQQLLPRTLAWVLTPVFVACLFTLGTRALDYE